MADARDSALARLYTVLVALLVLPALVVVQMGRIYLAEGSELRERGEQQAASFQDLPAQRGAIYDRAGRALVVNTARYVVEADPTIPGFEARQDELAETLAAFTDRSADDYRRMIRDRASRQYVLLVRNLDEAAKEQLDLADFPGVMTQGSFARRYNYASTASHVLGHVTSDLNGSAGLELMFDRDLSGEPGRQATQRDRRGRTRAIVGGTRTEPRDGQSLVLTIDLVRQAILEEELAKGVQAAGARWGTAVAMNPRTGEILALANAPTYDPNRAGQFTNAARRNHAVVDRIEPGSTFKLVTAVAGLESGTLTTKTPIATGNGSATFASRTIYDTQAHGTVSFGRALAVSSNVAMAKAARQIGPAPMYTAARALGFGEMTTIDLPGEVDGLLRRPEDWDGTTLASMAMGYAVEVTPLQMLTAYAALANGGVLVHPHVVKERLDADGDVVWTAPTDSVRRAFSAETAAALLPYFEQAVATEGGTARRAAVEGLRVAGKTGTAKKAVGGGYGSAYRASFAGLFPVEDPEVVMLVVLDSPQRGFYGGTVAAPIFGATAQRWVGTFPSVAERMAPAGEVTLRASAPLPAIDELPTILAASRLRAEGFSVRTPKGDAWAPARLDRGAAGDTLRLDKTVRLDRAAVRVTESGEPVRTMPDLRGRSARQAVAWLRSLGVAPRLRGTGTVRAQSIAPGAPLGAVTLHATTGRVRTASTSS